MFGGRKMVRTSSILEKMASSSSVNIGQTKTPAVAGTGDAELVLFKPKCPSGCTFDCRTQALHQVAVKACNFCGSAQTGAEMDVSQQAESCEIFYWKPAPGNCSHLIHSNFAQWWRFSHIAIKSDFGRQIAERAVAPENEGITSGHDCSSLTSRANASQAQDFPLGSQPPDCYTAFTLSNALGFAIHRALG